MTDEDRKVMREEIEATIRTVVNGKIDKLTIALQSHVDQHAEDQKRMEPLLTSFNNWSWLKQMIFTIFFPTITAIGALGGLVSLFNWIEHR